MTDANDAFFQATQLSNSKVFMEGAQTLLGGPIEALGQWLDGLSEKVRNMEAKPVVSMGGNYSLGGRGVDADRPEPTPISQAKSDPSPDIGQKIEKNVDLVAQVSNAGLKFPEGTTTKAVHVDNSDLALVSQSAMTTGLGGPVQTQEQGRGV